MRHYALFILSLIICCVSLPLTGCSDDEPQLCRCGENCTCGADCTCGATGDNNDEEDPGEKMEEPEAWNPEILGQWRNRLDISLFVEYGVLRNLEWVELDFKDESTMCVNYGTHLHATDAYVNMEDTWWTDEVVDEGEERSTELYSYKMTASTIKIYTLNTENCISELNYRIENGIIILERKKGENFPTFNVEEIGYSFIAPSVFAYDKNVDNGGYGLESYTVENYDNPIIGTWKSYYEDGTSWGHYFCTGPYQLRMVFESNNEMYCASINIWSSAGSVSYTTLDRVSKRYRYTFEDNLVRIYDPDTSEEVNILKFAPSDGNKAYFTSLEQSILPDLPDIPDDYARRIYSRIK